MRKADNLYRLGIPGQYDAALFRDTVASIVDAAEKASTNEHKVFVGLGGLETRPDILEVLLKKHSCIRHVLFFSSHMACRNANKVVNRFAMAGRDISLLMGAMKKQTEAMETISLSLSQ